MVEAGLRPPLEAGLRSPASEFELIKNLGSRGILLGMVRYAIGIWAVIIIGTYGAVLAYISNDAVLRVVFLDVGQGDSIYIEAPNGKQVLIDGGRGSRVLSELAAVMPFLDTTLDVVLITHPDSDHIGGVIEVLEQYDVHAVLMTHATSSTKTYAALVDAIETEGADVVYVVRGTTVDLGDAIVLTVLFPEREVLHDDSNSGSVIAQLVYGESEFLFTGDAPSSVEMHMVDVYGNALQSDVLKAGHHGSKTSTAQVFLETVDPDYVVISAGENNRYGHPHDTVVDRITQFGSVMLGTYTSGRVEFISDGRSIEYR